MNVKEEFCLILGAVERAWFGAERTRLSTHVRKRGEYW